MDVGTPRAATPTGGIMRQSHARGAAIAARDAEEKAKAKAEETAKLEQVKDGTASAADGEEVAALLERF